MLDTNTAFGLAAALTARSVDTGDGHRVWTGDYKGTFRHDRVQYTYRQAAHLIRTGYPPLGQLRTTCGTVGCFLHLTDLGAVPAPTTAPNPRWRHRAACLDHDPNLFFPEDHHGPALTATAEALAICDTCPVRAHCLDDALAEEGGIVAASRFGIRGGLTSHQRHSEYQRRNKRQQLAQAAA